MRGPACDRFPLTLSMRVCMLSNQACGRAAAWDVLKSKRLPLAVAPGYGVFVPQTTVMLVRARGRSGRHLQHRRRPRRRSAKAFLPSIAGLTQSRVCRECKHDSRLLSDLAGGFPARCRASARSSSAGSWEAARHLPVGSCP